MRIPFAVLPDRVSPLLSEGSWVGVCGIGRIREMGLWGGVAGVAASDFTRNLSRC